MKKQMLVITALMLAIWCVSCTDNSTASLEKKVTDLETKLEKSNHVLATLATTVYWSAKAGLFDDPLDRFFSAPEFWQNTYEVDPSAGCYARCAENYAAAVKTCQMITNTTERLTCVNRAYQNLTSCSSGCRGLSSPPR